jgi:Flp pilus assembly protein TadD/LysM repeat protein
MVLSKGVLLTFLALAVSIFFLSGCSQNSTIAGKDTLKDPFANKYPVKNLPRQATNPAQRDVPLKEPPEMTAAEYERSGDDYFNSGNLQQAFLQYDKSVRLEPENLRIRYKIGLLFLLNKMFSDAMLEFQEVMRKEPQNALAHEGMGLALFQQQKIAEAERYFIKALELNQNLWKSHNCLGIIYDKRKDYPRAIAAYQKAIALKQDNALLYNNLGLSYLFSGNYDSAIKAFDTAMGFRSVPNKVYNNMGLALGLSGRYQEALETFKKVSDEATAYNNLGCVLLMKGDYERANQAFEKAIKLKPSFYTIANENLKKSRTGASGSSKLDFLTDKPQAEIVKAEDFNLEELPPPKQQTPEPVTVIKEPPKVKVQSIAEDKTEKPAMQEKTRVTLKPEVSPPVKKVASAVTAKKTEPLKKPVLKSKSDVQPRAHAPVAVSTEKNQQPARIATAAPAAEKAETKPSAADATPAQAVQEPPIPVSPPPVQPAAEGPPAPSPAADKIATGSELVAAVKTEAPAPENTHAAAPAPAQEVPGEAVIKQETAEKPPETASPAVQAADANTPSAAGEAAPAHSDAPQPAPITEQAQPAQGSVQQESKSSPADKPAEPAQPGEQATAAKAAPAPQDAVPAVQPAAETLTEPGAAAAKPEEKQETAKSETGAPEVTNQVSEGPAAMQKPAPLPEAGQAGANAPSGEELKAAANTLQADAPAGSEPVAETGSSSNILSAPAPETKAEGAPEPTAQIAPVMDTPPQPETEQKKEATGTESETEKKETAATEIAPSAPEKNVTAEKTPAQEVKPTEKQEGEKPVAVEPDTKKTVKPPAPKIVRKPAPAKKENIKQIAKAAAPKARAPQYHSVAQGDTLMSLSRKYNVDVNTLRKLNGLYEESVLKVGSKIRIH